ncbi:unnamed protein product [Effrenium voratum]|uniref:Myosin heavy chain n=1 Tax=Effrenium voratum TaxID=2562239 RepID=A0AA36HXQ9_9DINO|nr:unnamed protein product [Effrenium voratum]CAJ1376083.1 unnamed protein product [Effrenium voratum]CAJ1460564.1 unnamed protein product [Effrenium voratum]|mmetsp:Transcript_119464/g.283580  ORF Transcript_119464/g.283580 Transcript_119464/m.283580 type:complete len:395 (+) Transcript_119464:50-1234(+)|eukprot:CAMPEP_0181427766 /NCGR_PEP_ID=MMETSP1110-20121109/16338_1 /TAXON_ID=174948 /ORGANISM="Symbiodinium sp., Strain CCMP421" /LENGTH=394 /DNA_ID=CAMNT_0023550983 /DNA_START=21 /DNA_END=1205 /DNA_ORIENTATION=+
MAEEAPASPAGDAQAPVDEESASRTFFTGIDAEAGKKKGSKDKNRFRNLEATDAGNKIMTHFQDLTHLANSLDLRMEALLKEHEQDFFLAYKTHMYKVQKDIKLLRMKAEQEEAKTREDTKIKALEGELDRFMTQALRLDELCKGYKKEVDKWKAKAEALDEDRRFLEDQIKGAKRQNKILRAAAERARSSAYSALNATKAKSEGAELEAEPSPPLGEVGRRPASSSRAVGSAARRVMEARSATPEVASRGPDRLQDAITPAGTRAATSGPTGRSVLGNEAEQRYVEAIQSLKEGIQKEQYNVRMLQAARATSYSHKSEMEEFFLKCIDEARKELMRKKHITVNWEKSDREKVLEAMLNNEDILVCLYEKLFPHRTGIARSLGGANEGPQTLDF